MNEVSPYIIFTPEELYPSRRALAQLRRIASDARIHKPIIGLVDIHDKKGNDVPTGIVVASKSHIFPELMVSGPNCGMRMMILPFTRPDFDDTNIDQLFRKLLLTIDTKSTDRRLSENELFDVLSSGAGWVSKQDLALHQDVNYIELGGNAFLKNPSVSELKKNIPNLVVEFSKQRMGILGGGNHFLELQCVDKIYDSSIAEEFFLQERSLCILLHSGSGGFGAMLSHLLSPRSLFSREFKMHGFVGLERLRALLFQRENAYHKKLLLHDIKKDGVLFGLDADSGLAKIYQLALWAGSNFAYANRAYIGMQLRRALSDIFKVKPQDIKLLYDMSHMSINQEKHNGQFFWIHRIGGVRAAASQVDKEIGQAQAVNLAFESAFAKTGTPIFLPGSMGDATYICVSTQKNSCSYFSASHGAGRLAEESISSRAHTRNELTEFLHSRNVTLYNGCSKSIVKQDPRCFKNVDKIVEYLSTQGLVKKVARLIPLAVLKG